MQLIYKLRNPKEQCSLQYKSTSFKKLFVKDHDSFCNGRFWDIVLESEYCAMTTEGEKKKDFSGLVLSTCEILPKMLIIKGKK